MKKGTGIGGIFFKSKDVAATNDWYRDQLGFKVDEWGASLAWGDVDPGNKNVCNTAWSAFKEDSKHFAPSTLPYMFNYRVHDIKALIDDLRKEGVEVVGGIDEYDYGKFAWVMDAEGRKIELWEPIDAGFGPPNAPWTEKVVGLGGIFFKSDDPEKTKAWYKKHLGIEGGFEQLDLTTGKNVFVKWEPLDNADEIFSGTDKPYVFAYRMKGLEKLSTRTDNDGNKIILQPG